MWTGDWGWGGWTAMVAAMAMFWLLVAVVGLVVLRLVRDGGGSGTLASRESPEQILEARYARGEIDTVEFEHRRRVLRAERTDRRADGSP
jgi:putative membrane protein